MIPYIKLIIIKEKKRSKQTILYHKSYFNMFRFIIKTTIVDNVNIYTLPKVLTLYFAVKLIQTKSK